MAEGGDTHADRAARLRAQLAAAEEGELKEKEEALARVIAQQTASCCRS